MMTKAYVPMMARKNISSWDEGVRTGAAMGEKEGGRDTEESVLEKRACLRRERRMWGWRGRENKKIKRERERAQAPGEACIDQTRTG
jgi:hypothetical protein